MWWSRRAHSYAEPAEIASIVFLLLFKDGGDFIFLFLTVIKGMSRRREFKIFMRDLSDGKILLRSFASC